MFFTCPRAPYEHHILMRQQLKTTPLTHSHTHTHTHTFCHTTTLSFPSHPSSVCPASSDYIPALMYGTFVALSPYLTYLHTYSPSSVSPVLSLNATQSLSLTHTHTDRHTHTHTHTPHTHTNTLPPSVDCHVGVFIR